ncbi:hypothetical protein [Nocardia arthritidis]|nr:hypothetical protein [Nocardia arthritidis]
MITEAAMIHLPPDAPVRALPIAGHDQRVLEPEEFTADAAIDADG